MRTARRPALRAPLTATVATGTPFGIWTIDSRLSRPSRWASATGTPMTGSGVTEASMPGRCAAPPAPAITHAEAAAGCLLTEGEHVARRAVGGDDPHLVGDVETLEHLDRALHHREVRRAAHHDRHDRRALRHGRPPTALRTPSGNVRPSGAGVPRARAAVQARERTTSASSPHTVTCPSLRPALAPLP